MIQRRILYLGLWVGMLKLTIILILYTFWPDMISGARTVECLTNMTGKELVQETRILCGIHTIILELDDSTSDTPADSRFPDYKLSWETWAPQWWRSWPTTSIKCLRVVSSHPRPLSGVAYTVSPTMPALSEVPYSCEYASSLSEKTWLWSTRVPCKTVEHEKGFLSTIMATATWCTCSRGIS